MAPRKTRSRSPHPDDRTWVSSTMRKRGMTAIKRNYQFGKDCGTVAVLLFYNKIHGFWDGSVYLPDGESLPENTNDVIQDVWRRQAVSNGELVLRPARQRKQSTKAKPCKVTKSYKATKPAPKSSPRVLSLRSRRRTGDGSPGSGASPIQPQITVAGDESEAEDDGASIWDVPSSPAPRVTRSRGRGNARPDEPAIQFRNDASLDRSADNAVCAVDSADGQTEGHTDSHIDGNGNGEGDGHNHGNRDSRLRRRRRRREVRDRSEPVELNNAASSHLHDHVPNDQDTEMPYNHMADEDAEGEPWGEPAAPFAPMDANGPAVDAVQLGHGDEPESVDLTTMMADDAWMHSAMADFGDAINLPDTQHWGDMLEFDLDSMGMDMNTDLNMEMINQLDNGHLPIDMIDLPSVDPDAGPQAFTEAGGNLDDGGLANGGVDADADADAGNDAANTLQASAATASDSQMPSVQPGNANGMQARTALDETHPSPRSTAVTSWPDNSKHTTAAVENGVQPGHLAGNQLLAIITQALSQMNGCEDVEPDMNCNTGWPVPSQGMMGMPPMTPAC